MKLKCPNCQAQYEIPDVAIPDAGRDVQCANCNETWFQVPPGDKAKSGESAAVAVAVAKTSDPKTSDPKTNGSKASDPPASGDEPVKASPRRELSPAVSDILRQEAAHEEQARAAKANDPLTPTKSSFARSRRGRERLPKIPDVDVSNPRLNPSPEVTQTDDIVFDVDTDLPEVARKTGFKRGFSLIVLLMGGALLLYVLAPELAQKYPSLLGPLQIYVNAVNSARLQLYDLASSLMDKL